MQFSGPSTSRTWKFRTHQSFVLCVSVRATRISFAPLSVPCHSKFSFDKATETRICYSKKTKYCRFWWKFVSSLYYFSTGKHWELLVCKVSVAYIYGLQEKHYFIVYIFFWLLFWFLRSNSKMILQKHFIRLAGYHTYLGQTCKGPLM